MIVERHYAVRKAPDRKTIWWIIILISGVLTEPEKPELNTTLKLVVCLLFRVPKSLVDYARKNWVGVRSV